jgi:hypothetical protein
MSVSKVKSTKQKLRLKARIQDWENIRGQEATEKKKFVNRSCFTKPGSNKK